MRENKPAMINPFGGRIEYVRLSVTDRCNLRYTYYLPKGFTRFEESDEWLQAWTLSSPTSRVPREASAELIPSCP
jgi:molybdenum cofactor biosynthesis enzyme MoaA